jgi:hypothetical protein
MLYFRETGPIGSIWAALVQVHGANRRGQAGHLGSTKDRLVPFSFRGVAR